MESVPQRASCPIEPSRQECSPPGHQDLSRELPSGASAPMGPPPKYPRIPHLAPIAGMDRDDLLLDNRSRDYLLAHHAVVEEKLDGANISIWIEDSVPRIGTRGGPNTSDRGGQRGRARAWAAEHADELRGALGNRYAVYAEWLLRRQRVCYDRLMAPLVGIDVFDAEKRQFLPLGERDAVLASASLEVPPVLFTGTLGSVVHANSLIGTTAYGSDRAEGIVIKASAPHAGVPRMAKLIRSDWQPRADAEWESCAEHNMVIAP